MDSRGIGEITATRRDIRWRTEVMMDLLQDYGLWIALGVVFLAMHWFGMGCCGRRHGNGAGRQQRMDPGPEGADARRDA
jgi:hypothetical protein